MFIPLVLLGMYNVIYEDKWVMLAIAMLDEEKHSIWYDKYKWSGNPNGRDDYIAKPGEF